MTEVQSYSAIVDYRSADHSAYVDALDLIIRLNALLDQLCVRGLRALGGEDLNQLRAQCSALQEIGATELSTNLEQLIEHLNNDHQHAAAALLRARASVRVFERLLSLRMVAQSLSAGLSVDEDPADEY